MDGHSPSPEVHPFKCGIGEQLKRINMQICTNMGKRTNINIIWPDIEECKLVRFRHVGAFCMQVDAFSVRLHGFFK